MAGGFRVHGVELCLRRMTRETTPGEIVRLYVQQEREAADVSVGKSIFWEIPVI